LVTVEFGTGLELGRIRGGDGRFGHGEAGRDLGRHQGPEPTFPLRFRGVAVQHQRVLQSERAERYLTPFASTLDLVDEDVIGERHTPTADLTGVTESPQPLVLGL